MVVILPQLSRKKQRVEPRKNPFDLAAPSTYRSVGFMSSTAADSATRRRILKAALRRFAHCGYAAASVQQIVDDAKVSKPTLYYYFKDKVGLFQALVDEAHDELPF